MKFSLWEDLTLMIQPSLVHTYIIFFKLDQKKVREEHKTNYLGIQADKMNKKKKSHLSSEKKTIYPSTLLQLPHSSIYLFLPVFIKSCMQDPRNVYPSQPCLIAVTNPHE